ncbi:MAG: GntR family transcriptional regulator, partial [Clostridiales bacterium]
MITIDYKDRRPIYQQLITNIENMAINGILPVDSQLPSVRSLAMELSINPNTIQRAYQELEKKG